MSNPLQQHYKLGRVLALLALVAVLGGQLLEVQHSHAFSDPVSGCLLCQGAASVAVATASQTPDFSVHTTTPQGHTTSAAVRPTVHQHAARGPPRNT